MRRKLVMAGILMALAVLAVAGPVWAAGSTGPLSDVYTALTEWAQGNVGKVIALGMILVGIVAGIANQSLMAFAVGIGGGLGLYNAPTIIDTVFNATLTAGML
jgi:conjugal transfer pilus assembly protein TraA